MNFRGKRLLAMVTILILVFSTSVMADTDLTKSQVKSKEYTTIRNEILSEYQDTDEFEAFLKDDRKAALAMIDRLTADAYYEEYVPQPKGGYGYVTYCYVDTVPQAETNYCAYATMMQTFYGIGIANQVAGSDDDERQETLATDMGTSGSAPYVYQVTSKLNEYVSTDQYEFTEGATKTQSQFAADCQSSLYDDRPVLLHARTVYISYYNNKALGHYLSLDRIDLYNANVRIVDCNYDTTYQGVHNDVSLSDAYDSIEASSRYYICD